MFREPGKSGQLTVLRVSVGSECLVTIQSARPVWTGVHWAGGGTVLCPGGGCGLCAFEEPRIVGFLVVTLRLGGSDREVPALLEVAGASWDRFRGLAGGWGSEFSGSGWSVEVCRTGKRRAVSISPVSDHGIVVPELGAEERVLRAIAVLLKLPLPNGEIKRETVSEVWRLASLSRTQEVVAARRASRGSGGEKSGALSNASNGR